MNKFISKCHFLLPIFVCSHFMFYMKKSVVFVVLFFCFFSSHYLYSQEYLSLKYGGGRVFSKNSNPYTGPSICYLHPINESATLGLNIGYFFGDNNSTMINIEPRVDMFTEQYNGFYLGSNIGFSKETYSTGGSSNIYLGLRFGYAITIVERIVIDISNGSSFNIGLGGGGSQSGFQIQPTLGLGFVFDKIK